MRALNGQAYVRGFARLLETSEGGRIAYERVELADRLADPAFMASFPAGSVGAAYRDFVTREHLSAQGLIDESHKGLSDEEFDPRHPYAWYSRRIRDLATSGTSSPAMAAMRWASSAPVTFSFEETSARRAGP